MKSKDAWYLVICLGVPLVLITIEFSLLSLVAGLWIGLGLGTKYHNMVQIFYSNVAEAGDKTVLYAQKKGKKIEEEEEEEKDGD